MNLNIVHINVFYSTFTNVFVFNFVTFFTSLNVFKIFFQRFLHPWLGWPKSEVVVKCFELATKTAYGGGIANVQRKTIMVHNDI